MSPAFQYQPLGSSPLEIRILVPTLSRSTPSAYNKYVEDLSIPLEFSIKTLSLSDAKEHGYKALSYVWGDATFHIPLKIDDSTMLITTNLEQALRHLRYDDVASGIWIDLICINQKDDAEKSIQVSSMDEIFGSAACVLAWLGPEKDYSDIAINFLSWLGRDNPDQSAMAAATQPSSTIAYTSMDEYLQHEGRAKVQAAVNALIKYRRWWTRVWIVQEWGFAQDAWLIAGNKRIRKDTFIGATKAIYKYAFDTTIIREYHPITEVVNSPPKENVDYQRYTNFIFVPPPNHFLAGSLFNDSESVFGCLRAAYVTFGLAGTLDATEPVDRIYGLQSLMKQDFRRLGLVVDYQKVKDEGFEEVYADVAEALIQDGRIELLSFCQKPATSADPHFPSWTPDWRNKITSNFTESGDFFKGEPFACSGSNPLEVSFERSNLRPTERIMKIRGVLVGAVGRTGSSFHIDTPGNDLFKRAADFVFEIRGFCQDSSKLQDCAYSKRELEEACWKVPVRGLESRYVQDPITRSYGTADYFRASEISEARYKQALQLFEIAHTSARVEAYGVAIRTPGESRRSKLWLVAKSLFQPLKALWILLSYSFTKIKVSSISWLKYRLALPWVWATRSRDACAEWKEQMGHDRKRQWEHQDGTSYFRGLWSSSPMTPFITEQGHVGVGLGKMQEKDVIYILFGSKVPYIFRPVDQGRYSLIGEAYVYGVMDGELVDGQKETEILHVV